MKRWNREQLGDWLRRNSVQLAMVVLAVFVIFRLINPALAGNRVAERERLVLRIMEEIHRSQVEQAKSGAPGLSNLLQLRESAAAGSLLKTDSAIAESPDRAVEVLAVDGYLFALGLADPDNPAGRSWSYLESGSEKAGRDGYSLFVWPARYGEESQWVFYIDHRGKLLGSWNHSGLLDGYSRSFPPAVHPLRDYLAAKKEDKDAEWFLFKALNEVAFPEPAVEQEP